jgi:hypothetical protein
MSQTSPLKRFFLILAWLIVALPLAWGVYQSVQRSIPLFSGEARIEPAK